MSRDGLLPYQQLGLFSLPNIINAAFSRYQNPLGQCYCQPLRYSRVEGTSATHSGRSLMCWHHSSVAK